MDFSAVMKIASENKVSAQKQQQKQKPDISKTRYTSEEKVSPESVRAFLVKREEEKKRQKAEEEAARRARILARLKSENKAKAAKSSSSYNNAQTPAKSGKMQIASQSSKSKKESGSATEKPERGESEKSLSSSKSREKHNNSTLTLSGRMETEVSKKDKELPSKPKKQTSDNKKQKAGPVSFKDLLRIAEKKAKDPNARIGELEGQGSSFPTSDQTKQKQIRKGEKIVSNSHMETKSRHETKRKERKTEQIGSGKVAQSGTKTQPPQNPKHRKISDPSPSASKVNKPNPTAQKGSSIQAQLGLSVTKVKTRPATSSKSSKAPQNSNINSSSQQNREKRFVDRREVPGASGIEAQFGSTKRTSQERKRKHDNYEFDDHSEKHFDRKTVKRDLPRASGIEAQLPRVKGTAPKQKYQYEGDEIDDDEFDDFIDDGEDYVDVSSHIREIFGYDKSRYKDSEDDLRGMESSYSQIEKEESKSLQIARLEDEVEFLKEQAMLQKEREKLKRSLKHK